MSAAFTCRRCKANAGLIDGPLPLPEDLAELVRENVCAACWGEWQDMEVMVINELRLNFMDPAAQTILHTKMREFFELEPSEPPR